MNDDVEGHVVELLCSFVLGCLDDEETARVQQHLSACPVCCRKLAAYQAATDALVLATPCAVPPAALKSRLMAAICGFTLLDDPERPWARAQRLRHRA